MGAARRKTCEERQKPGFVPVFAYGFFATLVEKSYGQTQISSRAVCTCGLKPFERLYTARLLRRPSPSASTTAAGQDQGLGQDQDLGPVQGQDQGLEDLVPVEDPVVRDQVGQDQAEVRVLRQGPVEAMADLVPVARVVQAAMAAQDHARTFCLPDFLGQAFFCALEGCRRIFAKMRAADKGQGEKGGA